MRSLEQCVNEIMTDDTCDRPVCLSVCPDRMTDLTEGLVRCRGRNGLWVGRGGIQVFPTDIMTAFQCVASSYERSGLPSFLPIHPYRQTDRHQHLPNNHHSVPYFFVTPSAHIAVYVLYM